MEKMKIMKKYKDLNSEWEKTTLEECLEHTEVAGYWVFGSVEKMLLSGSVVQTPFAYYKGVK